MLHLAARSAPRAGLTQAGRPLPARRVPATVSKSVPADFVGQGQFVRSSVLCNQLL